MLGGEARMLSPKDNIAFAMDELLNSLGFPSQLYTGSLDFRAFPVALRMFEKQWNSLVDGYNDLIAWLLKRLNRHFMWGGVTGTLRSVTLADDIERKFLIMQSAAGMDVSKTTALMPYGIDYMDEQERVIEEQKEIQKLQQKAMEEEQAQQLAGSGDAGEGAPGGPVGATPGDVYEQAGALAQQLLFQTPETLRRGELIKIKQSNPTLHALVLQRMDEIRQDMSSQGKAMLMQEAKQASAEGSVGFGAEALPAPTRISMLVSAGVLDYTQRDLAKIAMDIKRGVPHAEGAFKFVFRRMRGWE
jgi:hypothetical protein